MKKLILLLVLVVLVSGCTASERTIEYSKNIKEEYCGPHAGPAICSCAFHGNNCGQAGMTKEEAEIFIYGGFDEWAEEEGGHFKEECLASDGRHEYSNGVHTCSYCEGGMWDNVQERTDCVEK